MKLDREMITVRELCAIPELRTHLIAGQPGQEKPIAWAHACELTDPWGWLGERDLLLTTGMGFPDDEVGQITFITELARADLAGLALAEGMSAGPLTIGASRAANKLAFPILRTAYEVPFALLTRAVADANREAIHSRLVAVARIYDIYRQEASEARSSTQFMRRVGRELDAAVVVFDAASGLVLLTDGHISGGIDQAVLDAVRAHSRPLPAVFRVTHGSQTALALPVRSVTDQDGLVLMVLPRADYDPSVLQHVSALIAAEAARIEASHDRLLDMGDRLFDKLEHGSFDQDTISDELRPFGLATGPWQVMFVAKTAGADARLFQRTLLRLEVPSLVFTDDSAHRILVPGDESLVNMLIKELVTGAQCGISDPVGSLSHVSDAIRQARWAFGVARTSSRNLVRYGTQASSVLPMTLIEARHIVDEVLGPLLTYERDSDPDLLLSLEEFVNCGRSWKKTAERLHVHKQTLVYRIRRVEEILGRDLKDIDDLVPVYVALRSLRLFEVHPSTT